MLYHSCILQLGSAKIQIQVQIHRAQEEIHVRRQGAGIYLQVFFNSTTSVETKGSEDHKLFQRYCHA